MAALLLTGASLSTVVCDALVCLTVECGSLADLCWGMQACLQNHGHVGRCRWQPAEIRDQKGFRLSTILAVHRMSLPGRLHALSPCCPRSLVRQDGQHLPGGHLLIPVLHSSGRTLISVLLFLSLPEIYGALAMCSERFTPVHSQNPHCSSVLETPP